MGVQKHYDTGKGGGGGHPSVPPPPLKKNFLLIQLTFNLLFSLQSLGLSGGVHTNIDYKTNSSI